MRGRNEVDLWPGLIRLNMAREQPILGQRQMALLRQIAATGSITHAAKAVKLSYKAAWDAVNAMNNLAEQPLVVGAVGGKHGGGSRLTEYGLRQLQLYQIVENEYQRFFDRVNEKVHDADELAKFLRRLLMQTSARNQFLGRITALNIGPISAEVKVDIGNGDEIIAVITRGSVEQMGLREGSEVYALVKASSVIIMAGDAKLKLSARNQLRGTVAACKKGTVNGEVTLQLAGGKTVTATITNTSIAGLYLKAGDPAVAVIKAASVILGVAL
ncbi:MAG: TOBE domain-containing protein [Candidatus Competibacteraceae bacterium]|nr:TOBE domain-containing protein [Candidatus Competibacteraceae bacterium]